MLFCLGLVAKLCGWLPEDDKPKKAAATPAASASKGTKAAIEGAALNDPSEKWLTFPLLDKEVLWPLGGSTPGNDEFERHRNQADRASLETKVRTTVFLYRVLDEELGEYDFTRKAFPISYQSLSIDGVPKSTDHMVWQTCICAPTAEVDKASGKARVYRWTEPRQVFWLEVPEDTAQALAKKHRGHVDINFLVQLADVTTNTKNNFSSERKGVGSTLVRFRPLGPVRVTGVKGESLLDTLPKFPEITPPR